MEIVIQQIIITIEQKKVKSANYGYGDAILEITSGENVVWFNDISGYLVFWYPFLSRGGIAVEMLVRV